MHKNRKMDLDDGDQLGGFQAFDELAPLLTAFSQTSAIELAVYDNQLRFRAVNNAAAAITGTPAEAFVGKTMRDIIGDAALEPAARLHDILHGAENPSIEIAALLPTRTGTSYWIQKSFPVAGHSARVTQIASLAVEVTDNRKLEQGFRKLAGELFSKNKGYQRLAGELHDSINEYHVALGMSLDRLSGCTRDPERIPELMAQSMEFLDKPLRKLTSVVARCFPVDHQH